MTTLGDPAAGQGADGPVVLPLPKRVPSADDLDAVAAVCGFLANLLLRIEAAPTALANLDDHTIAGWPLAGLNAATDRGLVSLKQAIDSPNDADTLETDYRQLFVGPGTMQAPPWESVHLSDEGLTFQAHTLGVREAYAEFGLQAPALHKEPDDHIGLELAFLGQLAVAALTSGEAGDVGAQGAVLAAMTQFLHEHLLMWAPEFARLTIAAAQTPLYRAVGELLAGALGWLAELLPDQG